MSKPNPAPQAASAEILTQWEGPVIHELGVLIEEAEGEHLAMGADVALAVWIVVPFLVEADCVDQDKSTLTCFIETLVLDAEGVAARRPESHRAPRKPCNS